MCIINTGAIVEHDCKIGSFSHIVIGSVLCGRVTVGEHTLIGANSTVIWERKIGYCCIIGAGVTIRKDVEENSMVSDARIIKIRWGHSIEIAFSKWYAA